MKKVSWLCALVMIAMMLIPTLSVAEAAYTTADKEYVNLSEEGTIIQGDGYQIELRYCGPEGKRVFGRLYYPADFDATKNYSAIVMNHGGGNVCYAIDCRSSYDGQRDYSTPNDDHVATVDTYARDLIAATRFVQALPYVDLNNVYLSGQSMGCMAAQVAGARIPEEVAGLLLL